MTTVSNEKKKRENKSAAATITKRIGQNSDCISIGDGSVVTKMEKKKPAKMTFKYIPSGTDYSPEQVEAFKVKEAQLISYVIEHLLHQKTLVK